ncbi:MAG: DEAD/DEAH box helicase [Thermoplasmatota archaeon]
MTEEKFFQHSMIREESILRRDYQTRIATKALSLPTLVVLPTGLGKTVVALMVVAERLKNGAGQVLMMAPTKPLVEQHRDFLGSHLIDVSVGMLTGEVQPELRRREYEEHQVIVSTPQVIKNDIITGILDVSRYSTIIFDEAHRAVGDYPYVFIAEMFFSKVQDGLTLGLTASPGHDVSRIYEVCRTLGIENIEVRVDSDPDVKPYIQELDLQRVKVELSPGMKEVISLLERMFLERVGKLQRMGVLRKGGNPTIKEILGAGGRIREMLSKAGKDGGSLYQAMSIQAQAMKVAHAMELAETQGAQALHQYLQRLHDETGSSDCSKATRAVVGDNLFAAVLDRSALLLEEDPPKVEALERFVKQKLREDPEARIIAFTHFRDTSSVVFDRLSKYDEKGIRPVRFVGQASRSGDKGLTQRMQKEILDDFRSGKFNVLIATSVAEEGLDIPGADLVIFYEPIPSEIRTIQRRGRTGRHSSGKVVVLMSRETRDIAYSFSARDKELRMERQLLALRRMLNQNPLTARKEAKLLRKEETPSTLEDFDQADRSDKIEIVVDQREMPSGVVEELVRSDVKVVPGQLGEGDYILSARVAVERKTAEDLANSLVDGRLFKQMEALRSSYERPILLVEGDGLFDARRISKNSMMGALVSINLDFNIPIIFTRDPSETARYMLLAAQREKDGGKSAGKVNRSKGDDLKALQIKVLSGLPGISALTAERLLTRFRTLEGVFNATEEELLGTEGIGKQRAKSIRNTLTSISDDSGVE